MTGLRRLQASFVLFLAWESACQTKRVSVPLPAPPAASAPAEQTPPPPGPSPQPANPPPTSTTPAQDTVPYQVNKVPPPAAPAAKKPTRPATAPAATLPSPQPAGPAAPAAPAPKLGDVLTADEQQKYTAAIDQSLSKAQTSLNAIGARQLNKDQQADVEQIRNFIKQAETTRSSDPAGAKSLAERAEVLARDLAASFH